MKHLKFISLILVFVLTFVGCIEYYQYPSELHYNQSQDLFMASDIPQVESSTISLSSDLDIHFVVKKNLKNRNGSSVSCILKNFYNNKLVHFKILKNGLIYGITSIYQCQQHTHLHLYQLF
ncbi:hypothetical protein ACQKCJ_18650 [Flavobacterium sp. NPDC079362]|uniref:hypothetical protein n=1 Tax=Flavobacterium sp. NPDC079362 TaxID=3390566 RepID=UPI003CFFC778